MMAMLNWLAEKFEFRTAEASSSDGSTPLNKEKALMTHRPGDRQNFLQQWGLMEDPFIEWVAEKDLNAHIAKKNYKNALFFYYYTSAYNEHSQRIPVQYLRQPVHQFIYGAPGSGKSSLRLWLDLDCRTITDGILTVTYTPGEGEIHPRTIEAHDKQLSEAFAIDLFVQILELLSRSRARLSSTQVAVLAEVIAPVRRLRRKIKSILENWENQQAGLEQEFQSLDRYPVQLVPPSRKTQNFLKKLDAALEQGAPTTSHTGRFANVMHCIEAARACRYKRVFILVDGVDNRSPNAENMFQFIQPLLEYMTEETDKYVFYKMFLPLEIRDNVQGYLSMKNHELFMKATHDTIQWKLDDLKKIIEERFRAAGAPYITSLDHMAGKDLKDGLEDRLIALADGSPRRLVEVISRLIDVHLRSYPDTDILFHRDDLEQTEKEMARLLRQLNPGHR